METSSGPEQLSVHYLRFSDFESYHRPLASVPRKFLYVIVSNGFRLLRSKGDLFSCHLILGRVHSINTEKLTISRQTSLKPSTEFGIKVCFRKCLRSGSIHLLHRGCHVFTGRGPPPPESMEFCLGRSLRILMFLKVLSLFSHY